MRQKDHAVMAIAVVLMPLRGKVHGEAMSTLANGFQR